MKLMKVVKLALRVVVLATLVGNVVYGYDYSSTISSLDGQAGDTTLNEKATNIVGAIISVMRIVGTGVAIIMLTAVAIKYLSAAPGDRADIKKHAVVYVVGAVVLFGASGILTIIQKWAGTI